MNFTLSPTTSGAVQREKASSADFDAFLEPIQTARGAPARGGAAQRRALRERIEAWARVVEPRLVPCDDLGDPGDVDTPEDLTALEDD